MKKETILQVVYIEEGADLDAFSSAYGITLLYPEAKILLPHALSPSVRLTINRFKDLLDKKTIRKKDLSKIDRLFLVDTSNIKKARQYLKNYLTENGNRYLRPPSYKTEKIRKSQSVHKENRKCYYHYSRKN